MKELEKGGIRGKKRKRYKKGPKKERKREGKE
jgi:hypothetical protein